MQTIKLNIKLIRSTLCIVWIVFMCAGQPLAYEFVPDGYGTHSHLSQRWDQVAYREKAYHLANITLADEGNDNPRSLSTPINVPLDPERSALHPPEGRLLGKYSLLARDMGYLIVPASVILGLLYVAPESVSNWDEEDKDNSLSDLGSKWWDNVSDGPVWDEDDWWLNWIMHPYWGAAYYIHARHYAYSRWESFWYSFIVSNVLYEYGVEAFAEEPSIQDLISTPVGGWLVGEFIFLPLEAKIIANDNTLFGSRALGKTARFLMDPLGSIIRPIRGYTQRTFGRHAAENPSGINAAPIHVYPMVGENLVGLHLRISLP